MVAPLVEHRIETPTSDRSLKFPSKRFSKAVYFFVTRRNFAHRFPLSRSNPLGGNMAKKRTKSDKAQRQADGLEKKLERRPAQVPKKAARE